MTKYDDIIETVFKKHFTLGSVRIAFNREELAEACDQLGIKRIKNIGDIPYLFRFRKELPVSIKATAPRDAEWIILGAGVGFYEFRLAAPAKIAPTNNRHRIKIPDATPEIVKKYAPGTDEQALLAKVRYNRLVDVFTGLTCYSIQNHLRTTVENIGQIEVDEIYLGVASPYQFGTVAPVFQPFGQVFYVVIQILLVLRRRDSVHATGRSLVEFFPTVQ